MRKARLGVFVRIRIFRIGGIYRISLAQLAFFATTESPAKMNERSPVKDAPEESCKSYNPVNPDSDKMLAHIINPLPIKNKGRGYDSSLCDSRLFSICASPLARRPIAG